MQNYLLNPTTITDSKSLHGKGGSYYIDGESTILSITDNTVVTTSYANDGKGGFIYIVKA